MSLDDSSHTGFNVCDSDDDRIAARGIGFLCFYGEGSIRGRLVLIGSSSSRRGHEQLAVHGDPCEVPNDVEVHKCTLEQSDFLSLVVTRFGVHDDVSDESIAKCVVEKRGGDICSLHFDDGVHYLKFQTTSLAVGAKGMELITDMFNDKWAQSIAHEEPVVCLGQVDMLLDFRRS